MTFFIDMQSSGVRARPIRQACGEAEFNEVFFHDVFVPDSQRIGAEGAGWKAMLTGLMNERLSIGGVMPADERGALQADGPRPAIEKYPAAENNS